MDKKSKQPKRREPNAYELECAARASAIKDNKGFTQEYLAGLLGITQGALSQYLNGRVAISTKFLISLSKALGCVTTDIDPERIIVDLYTDREEKIIRSLRNAPPELQDLAVKAVLGLLDQ